MEQVTTDVAVEHALLTSCENVVAQKKVLEQPFMQACCKHFSATRHTQQQ